MDITKFKHETYSMGFYITQPVLDDDRDWVKQWMNEPGVIITECDNGIKIQTKQEVEDCARFDGLP